MAKLISCVVVIHVDLFEIAIFDRAEDQLAKLVHIVNKLR